MKKEVIEKYIKLIEAIIHKQRYGRQPESLYEPIRYLMALGGQRLRPLLTLLSYSLYKKDVTSVVRFATAVEVFHNFTLMHDDIMDKAPLRRGQPTVHKKWNVSTAILSGDVMLVKAYEMFSELDADKFKEVIQAFNVCASQVCEGQQWDMEFESAAQVSEDAYLNMIKLKTSVLLGFALELGGILADAPKEERKALRNFGINIGIGFQLKDDLLDAYGDPKKFGKQVGGDILSNKKTYLLIKALEKSSAKQKRELEYWISLKKFDRKKKVAAVKAIYDALDIPSITEKKVNSFFAKGFKHLDLMDGFAVDVLKSYASSLMARQS